MSAGNKCGEFAGTMRERIRILRPPISRDVLGSVTGEPEEVGEFWAAAVAAGTGVDGQADSRASLIRWLFTLHKTDSILPGDQLIWGDRSMVIRNVSFDNRLIPRTRLLAEETR